MTIKALLFFIDNSDENLRKFEKTAKNMQSLSRYSRQNSINKEWLDEYLNEAHSQGLISVRAHCNVIAWGEDAEELKRIKNDVGSQLASMECVPRHNTVDCPTLYWAGMPGNAADFPSEESLASPKSGCASAIQTSLIAFGLHRFSTLSSSRLCAYSRRRPTIRVRRRHYLR